nr:MAG: hypothetical protein DIU78_04805 [Pseudomonadota bacterium]
MTSLGRTSPHRLTPFARVEGTRVTYPGDEAKALTLQARQSHAGSEEKAPQLGAPVAHSGSKAKSLRRDALAVGSGSNVKGRRPDARPAHSGSKAKSLLLETRAPFHLEATVRVLQRRPTNPVDRWVSDRYQRVLTTPHGLALVEVANEGTIDAPDVRLRVLASEHSTDASPISTVRRLLGLDVDPRPLQRLVEAESRLRSLGMALRGMRPPRFAGLFEAVANVVPFQQVSLDAGVAIVSRLVERFGATLEHDGTRHRAFPTAETIAGARLAALKACGMSQRKAETLERVARSIASGDLTEEALALMKSPDALRFLTELPGIGPWSASLILLRGLGRLDVFPPGDVGVTRGLSTLLRLPPGPSLTRIIDRFGDLRGYLYFYSLGGALLEKEWIRAAPSLQRPRRNVDRK